MVDLFDSNAKPEGQMDLLPHALYVGLGSTKPIKHANWNRTQLSTIRQDDFKGRHFEAWLIIQAVSWSLRYSLSYRNLEEMFLERGFEVDHSTLNHWVLAHAPLIETRLRSFRKPHCGSIRIDETYVKIKGQTLSLSGHRQARQPSRFPFDGAV